MGEGLHASLFFFFCDQPLSSFSLPPSPLAAAEVKGDGTSCFSLFLFSFFFLSFFLFLATRSCLLGEKGRFFPSGCSRPMRRDRLRNTVAFPLDDTLGRVLTLRALLFFCLPPFLPLSPRLPGIGVGLSSLFFFFFPSSFPPLLRPGVGLPLFPLFPPAAEMWFNSMQREETYLLLPPFSYNPFSLFFLSVVASVVFVDALPLPPPPPSTTTYVVKRAKWPWTS